MLDILEEIEKNGYHDMRNDEKQSQTFGLDSTENQVDLKSKTTGYNEEDSTKNVQVIIMKVVNDSFKLPTKTYELKMQGKTMLSWVENAVKDFDVREVEMNANADFLSLAKQNINGEKKYTLVLFADAPLIKSSTVSEIVEYFVIKDLSVLQFTRGYMFKTQYLLTIDKLYAPQVQYFEEEDFITCYNLKQFALVNDILKSRILSYHQKNGVVITDPVSTIIEADVSIEEGVKLLAGSKILGNSVIEKGAVISYNSIVDSSVVMTNSFVENSIIKNSIIGKNCVIKNYSIVEQKAVIGDNCTLCGYNLVKSKSLLEGVTLEEYEKRL